LQSIYEPVVVTVPPGNAWRDICVMPDGEIRIYGSQGKRIHSDRKSERIYLASRDCGLSWKKFSASPNELGQSVRSPYSGKYITVLTTGEFWNYPSKEGGTYVITSPNSPASTNLTWKKISNRPYQNFRTLIPLRNRQRWIAPAQIGHPGQVVLLLSDDDGETWREVLLKSVPKHEIKPPHQGLRWQNGACEPTITEFADGTLMLIARTSQDYHYRYFSRDGGETWTDPEPSGFHGTLTMPTLYCLSDGRTLFFWCNTQPLPELRHEDQFPPLSKGEISGEGGEDVFTNRDANHAAISDDDGKTWKGFREIWLNTIRNDADFRTQGGSYDTLDKSIHQFEALELPFGKVLLSFGQHWTCRKVIIFDPKWLYEKSRSEDFRTGMGKLSTQVYLKSISGDRSGNLREIPGHCTWNRTNGAVMVPDPGGNFQEALLISRIKDERLFSEIQGAVWNFPATNKGEVKIRLRVRGEGIHLSLTDRWFNPIDVTIKDLAQFTFTIGKNDLPVDSWTEVRIVWDAEKRTAELFNGDNILLRKEMQTETEHGLSYLHIQSLAETEDSKGTLIKKLEMKFQE
ncbi:MAG: glycoside hydrolase, partial [Planctomycetaceae bacterium]|nr:glycoside hydrolase [Planctomycetaceae bacterium]